MQRSVLVLICLLGLGLSSLAQAQGFAAQVSPPRFELATKPGKTLRGVFELSNRSTAPAHYRIHTADWSLSADFSVSFHDELPPLGRDRATRGRGARCGHHALPL
ncbi:MAG: hypothetical protein ACHQDD_01260 [Steroidobacterales bacterium]